MIKFSSTLFTASLFAVGFVFSLNAATDGPYSQIINAQKDGRYPEALSKVSDLLKQNENDVQALLLKGNINKLMGDTDSATVIFKTLISQYPQMPEAYNNLAVLYADQGNSALAIETLQQVFTTQSSYGTAYKNLRTLYNQMASSAYRDALDIRQQPKKKQSQFALLNTVQMNGQNSTAATTAPLVAAVTNAKADTEAQQRVNSAMAQSKTAQVNTQPKPKMAQVGQEAAIKAVIKDWSKAWAGRKIKDYFGFYHQEFVPPESMSRKRWEKYRGIRLSKPTYINIDIIGVAVKVKPDNTAAVIFEQHYRSNTYSDTVVKQLMLKKHKGKWLITKELSL